VSSSGPCSPGIADPCAEKAVDDFGRVAARETKHPRLQQEYVERFEEGIGEGHTRVLAEVSMVTEVGDPLPMRQSR
jgi:hypothetical protein